MPGRTMVKCESAILNMAALLALTRGVVAPTLNLEDPDPACDLDYVPLEPRINDVRTALVAAMSFGGTHSAAVLRRAG